MNINVAFKLFDKIFENDVIYKVKGIEFII